MLRSSHLFFFLLVPLLTSGQIQLVNSSFEGEPQDATVPVGWFPCEPGTTPDILPGPWGVYNEPSEGNTYVGLITRENGSHESIGQRLSEPLQPGSCYVFKVDVGHSDTYAGYSGGLKLRIWGGPGKCELEQLLLETEMIEDDNWTTFEVTFTPKEIIHYLTFEAHFREGPFNYPGNILLDNITPVKICTRASL